MKTVRTVAGCLAGAAIATMMGAVPAHAAPGHTNQLPYESGCARGAYAVASHGIAGGTGSMMYSPACGTNWIEWHGPRARVTKVMTQPSRTSAESDYLPWSYSRQVYAPGRAVSRGEITVYNAQGGAIASMAVTCGATCSWESLPTGGKTYGR